MRHFRYCLSGLLAVPIVLGPSLAHAEGKPNCSGAAKSLLTDASRELLSVSVTSKGCTIIYLVVNDGERPRKLTVRIPVPQPSGGGGH